jgi:hypothetical protein
MRIRLNRVTAGLLLLLLACIIHKNLGIVKVGRVALENGVAKERLPRS